MSLKLSVTTSLNPTTADYSGKEALDSTKVNANKYHTCSIQDSIYDVD